MPEITGYSCFHGFSDSRSSFEFLRMLGTNDVVSLIKTHWADFSQLTPQQEPLRAKRCQPWPNAGAYYAQQVEYLLNQKDKLTSLACLDPK